MLGFLEDAARKAKLELVYKASRDGFTAKEFHLHCDGLGPTLVLCKSTDSSTIFGGYANLPWNSGNGYVKDDKSWLFSMKTQKKYTLTEYNQYAYFHNSNSGPTWGGGHDLTITGNGKSCYSNLGHTYSESGKYE